MIALDAICKQLLDEAFVISRIIKVKVGVMITLTETLIILGITKTECNNFFLLYIERNKLLARATFSKS